MEYEYKPYEQRTPDVQYKELLKDIYENGRDNPCAMVDGKTGEELFTRELLVKTVRFNILENGAPVIPDRDISGFYRVAIGELCGFINGARTQEELVKYGCKWWKSWLTEEKARKRGLPVGDLGDGSYGPGFHDFPMLNESEVLNKLRNLETRGLTPQEALIMLKEFRELALEEDKNPKTFNQFKEIIQQMKERPELKTHEISPWIPQYTIRNKNHQQKVVVCPCHGWLHFTIYGDTLNMSMRQRSCDTIVGLPSNWTQYTALLLAMSEVLGLKPGEFIHTMENAHIYSNDFEQAKELISREPKKFPTLKLVNKHDDIFDYRREDFELEDYNPHPAMKNIPIGV